MGPYWTKDEFVNWLKVQYHMDFDGLSFRIALSSFFRIYGKDNTDETPTTERYHGTGYGKIHCPVGCSV